MNKFYKIILSLAVVISAALAGDTTVYTTSGDLDRLFKFDGIPKSITTIKLKNIKSNVTILTDPNAERISVSGTGAPLHDSLTMLRENNTLLMIGKGQLYYEEVMTKPVNLPMTTRTTYSNGTSTSVTAAFHGGNIDTITHTGPIVVGADGFATTTYKKRKKHSELCK